MTRQEMKELQEEKVQMQQIYEEILKEQRRNFSILGHDYYKKVTEEGELIISELTSYIEEIKEAEIKISKLQQQMSSLDKELQEPVDNICPKCGKLMEVEAKFCSACGTFLKVEQDQSKENVCRSCGNTLKAGAHFCGKCGASVSEE